MPEKTCEEDLFCGINKAANKGEMTPLEQKHTPIIQAPASVAKGELFDVTIEVGKLLKHPNEAAHFIQWVELYSGHTFITRVALTPGMAEPKISVPVKLEHVHELRAVARCNLHGVWINVHTFE